MAKMFKCNFQQTMIQHLIYFRQKHILGELGDYASGEI